MSSNDPTNPLVNTEPKTHGRKATASKALLSTSKSLEEHLAGTGIRTDIITIISARKHLNMNGMNLSTAGGTITNIIGALLEMSLTSNLGAVYTESL